MLVGPLRFLAREEVRYVSLGASSERYPDPFAIGITHRALNFPYEGVMGKEPCNHMLGGTTFYGLQCFKKDGPQGRPEIY
jgi:hypothetical protein